MSEIRAGDDWKVGDRFTRQGHEGMILARDGKWAWVVYDSEDRRFTEMVSSLTRIEPDAPQFSVGQTVRFRQHGHSVYKVSAVKETTNAYALDGADIFWDESELEAVPPVCPTCGKVGDGGI